MLLDPCRQPTVCHKRRVAESRSAGRLQHDCLQRCPLQECRYVASSDVLADMAKSSTKMDHDSMVQGTRSTSEGIEMGRRDRTKRARRILLGERDAGHLRTRLEACMKQPDNPPNQVYRPTLALRFRYLGLRLSKHSASPRQSASCYARQLCSGDEWEQWPDRLFLHSGLSGSRSAPPHRDYTLQRPIYI